MDSLDSSLSFDLGIVQEPWKSFAAKLESTSTTSINWKKFSHFQQALTPVKQVSNALTIKGAMRGFAFEFWGANWKRFKRLKNVVRYV